MRIHRKRYHGQQAKEPELAFEANAKIRADELRVIGETGEMLGVMSRATALQLAEERESDLVVVSPKAVPPVAKLVNLGQFKYQKEKEARKQKAQSKQTETKVIRLTLRIGEHDQNVRMKRALEFLGRRDKVKGEIVLRGREKAHVELAKKILQTFMDKLTVAAGKPIQVEQPISYIAGRLTIVVGLK
ncbi:MAG: translation initiation factor IF-3 [Patescibacteria group bacterium]